MTDMTHDLLLEIGVEELPARVCAPALAQLKARATAALAVARLGHGSLTTLGTPRRLVLSVQSVVLAQEDRDVLVKGPAAGAAFDAEGRPTRAAEGFARAHGVAVADLTLHPAEKGVEYVYAHKHEPGQTALALLPALLRTLVYSMEFPESMRWGSHQMRFSRPIRWIVCLLGDQLVPVEVDGVQAARDTRGHRALAPAMAFPLTAAHDYADACARGYVMVDPLQRRAEIWRQVQAVAEDLGGYVPLQDDLLEEVTWLVEQPHAFHGRFDPAFLEVPAAVLVTSMREHQRYFPVFDQPGGALLPAFIAVRNGLTDHLDNVRHGNEKVLRARLTDARFFWDEDRATRLEERLAALRAVVFHAGLGSQYERTLRIERLAALVSRSLGNNPETQTGVQRTAHLCKCDLVTSMVAEFPELQGVMGREYARGDGEDPAVAEGIFEHYLPRGAGDAWPQTPAGVAVGLADRLNTLAGFFALGLIPTGSADPFALRRAAQGVTGVIVERRLRLSIGSLCDAALASYTQFEAAAMTVARTTLLEFVRARLEGLLKERGIRYDVVDAVLAAGFDDISGAVSRAEALHNVLDSSEFAAVIVAFKRIANIAAKAPSAASPVHASVAPESGIPAETALWEAFTGMRTAAETALAAEDYAGFYQLATQLKGPVDTFFEEVLVMDPDPRVRQQRLAMLREIAALLTLPADLSRLAVG